MRVCNICFREKKLDSFGRNKAYSDGYHPTCKLCKNEYQAKIRKNNQRNYAAEINIKLSGVKKSDWCETYSFLEKIGYNVEEDIHLQFVKKYKLEYKKRPSKNRKNYTSKDCLDCSN